MKTKFKPLKYPNKDTTWLLDHIESKWSELGNAPGIKQIYSDILSTKLATKLSAESLYDDTKIVGCYWLELISPHYGSITIHSIEKKYAPAIVERLVQNGIFLNAQIEIMTISFKDYFKELFNTYDLIINERQRMALWLKETMPFEIPKDEYSYFLMNEDYCDITGSISYEAHRISKDYKHYPDMNNQTKRIELEKKVFKGRSGPINEPASLMICKDNIILGYCLVVNVKNCWGYDNVPWIFDISVHPSYMGQGVGKRVLQMSINALINQDLSIMGLSATKTNVNAIKLYESVGFYWVDDFYEFIKPITTV